MGEGAALFKYDEGREILAFLCSSGVVQVSPVHQSNQNLSRRSVLATIASSALVNAASNPIGSIAKAFEGDRNRIILENQRVGTRDWMLTKTQVDPSTKYRSPWVEGYASHTSILGGETLQFMISTTQPTKVDIDVFRMGYYAGDGGCWVQSLKSVACTTQPTPEPSEHRLMDCKWQVSAELPISEAWLSGVYIAKLTEITDGNQSYIIFIVRDERASDFVFQCSDHTWQAYNRWPSQFSLYDDGVAQWYWGSESKVSFNRPYGKYCQILDAPLSTGSGEFFLWEFPFVHWLEREGYDVTYVSNTDTHRDSKTPLRGRGFLSVGHDEYWTIEMFRHVQDAVKQGTSVGFFSGNAVCGKVEWDAMTRSIRRVGVFGPPGGTNEFQAMSSLKHERPYANELIGAHSTGPVTGGSDWVCVMPEHWVYENTGMEQGDRIPGLIGWEYHGDPAPIPGLKVIATGPMQSAPNVFNGGTYTATVYESEKGNVVFNASTCWWADGLSAPPGYQSPSVYTSPKGVDARVQQITKNVLHRMLK